MIIVWIVCLLVASVIFRTQNGKPIIPRVPPDAVFSEGYASGRSRTNWLTTLGGPNNCLLVAVTPGELIVAPRFPFNLMFTPEIFGVELRIPLGAIQSIDRKPSLRGEWFAIVFHTDRPCSVALRVLRADAFAQALGR